MNNRIRKDIKWGLMAIVAVVALFGCSDPDLVCTDPIGCIEFGRSEPIRIATLLPETGDAAYLGLDALAAVELALADRDDALLGHPISLTQEDSGCTRALGQTAVARIITQPGHVGVIGPICSEVATAAIPVVNGVGMVMISPAATDVGLTAVNPSPPSFFRTIPTEEVQARVAAEFAIDQLNAQRAAIISDGSPYATTLQTQFATTFQALGGEVVFEGVLDATQADTVELTAALLVGQPEVLYLPLFIPEANYLLGRLGELPEMADLTVVGSDVLFVPLFPQATGTAVDGMYISSHALLSETYQAFLARWRARYDAPPGSFVAPYAYDAANLLLDAIETAAQTSSSGRLLIGQQALRDALLAADGQAALTGPYQCAPAGDCATGRSLGIYQLGRTESAGLRWPPQLVWKP